MKNLPAFPSEHVDAMRNHGLTKLEYFAGQAMQGILASGANQLMNTTNSEIAIKTAKELIKQLEAE